MVEIVKELSDDPVSFAARANVKQPAISSVGQVRLYFSECSHAPYFDIEILLQQQWNQSVLSTEVWVSYN